MSYNSRTADKFVVRLTDGLREKIAIFARDHHRSMNSQILVYLTVCVALEEKGIAITEENVMDAMKEAESAQQMRRMQGEPEKLKAPAREGQAIAFYLGGEYTLGVVETIHVVNSGGFEKFECSVRYRHGHTPVLMEDLREPLFV